MERNLVTIRRVDDVVKHPNADALDLLRIGGWQVVSAKGNFKTGDLCFFFEIDSILPDAPQFKFLIDKQGKQYSKGLGARLRTIKLRGAVSQGLAIPTSEFPEILIHSDVSLDEQLGVYKYEPEEQAGSVAANAKGSWPAWMPKTDQERVENCYNEMVELTDRASILWYKEEKMEGSSITIYVKDGEFGVTSRNNDLKIDGNLQDKFIGAAFQAGWDNILSEGRNLAIRGELCGPGIQGNIYKLLVPVIYVYDVWDIDNQVNLTPVERRAFLEYAAQALNIEINPVPSLTEEPIQLPLLDAIIEDANGESKIFYTKREGVVWKSDRVIKDRFGRAFIPSFKAISREYLLTEK